VHQIIKRQEPFEKGNYIDALQKGFVATDTALLEGESMTTCLTLDPHYEDEPSGCTATALLVTDKNVAYVANAGDSRTVLGRKGRAIPLSKDHKPYEQGTSSPVLTDIQRKRLESQQQAALWISDE
jgi:protein phosphatase 2C family protein 2/3